MTHTKRIEQTVLLGKDEEFLKVETDHHEGQEPREVWVTDYDKHTVSIGIEKLLRIAEAIKRAGWVPEGHYVCADHGLYDARSSDNARCSRCEVAS